MIIKNLTSDTLKLTMQEMVGEHRNYDFYLSPNGFTEVDWHFRLLNLEKLVSLGVLECSDFERKPEVISIEDILPDMNEEDTQNSQEDDSDSEDQEESEVSTDKIICEICGAEFASTRGLTSHKSRAHAE